MKRIIMLSALLLILSSLCFAKKDNDGFSVGILMGVSLDKEAPVSRVGQEQNKMDNTYITNSYDPTTTVNGGAFVRYINNGFIFRSGFEHYEMVKGKDYKGSYQVLGGTTYPGSYYKSEVNFRADAIPLLVGYYTYDKTTDVGFYFAVGAVVSKMTLEYHSEGNYYHVQYGTNNFVSDFTKDVTRVGAAGVIGAEKTFFKDLNVGFEYSFYYCEKTENVNRNFTGGGFPYYDSGKETIGLPRHTLRLLVSYRFF